MSCKCKKVKELKAIIDKLHDNNRELHEELKNNAIKIDDLKRMNKYLGNIAETEYIKRFRKEEE